MIANREIESKMLCKDFFLTALKMWIEKEKNPWSIIIREFVTIARQ